MIIALLSTAALIHFAIWLLVLAIVIYIVYLVLGMLPIPAPIKSIVCLVVGLIFLLVILSQLGIL